MTAQAPDVEAALVPAERVLRRAELRRQRVGHENAGFLSAAHGFTPVAAPLLRLDPRFAAWDHLAEELPTLYPRLTVRRAIEALPILPATCEVLPDAQLLRACALLGMLAHAYWYSDVRPPVALPEVIARPWAVARERLGRKQPVLSYVDLIVYNYRLKDPSEPRLTLENLELLFPTIGNQEERVFYLTQLEILARAAPMLQLTATAQRAALQEDARTLERCVEGMGDCLRELVTHALPKIDPRRQRPTYVDPVVWAKTVAPFAVPFERGWQGPSGTSSPLFSLLDVFFGRRVFQSFLGREIQQLRESYPPAWRAYLSALSRVSVSAYVERSADLPLRAAWHDALQLYTGPNGFLARHRLKVYGYLEQAFKVGRSVTIGGFAGLFRERTWDTVDDALRDAHCERPRVLAADQPVSAGVAPRTELPSYSVAQLCEHNTRQSGLWIVVDGAVYDVSRFIDAHPGGAHTLAAYAGMDASRAFGRVHGARADLCARLERLRIGTLRHPHFEGAARAQLGAAYHVLVQGMDALVEMQNALEADRGFSLRREKLGTTYGTPYELQRALETHLRFLEQYLRPLTETFLPAVLRRSLAEPYSSAQAKALGVPSTLLHVHALFQALERWPLEAVSPVVTAWLDQDVRLLGTLKARLRDALQALASAAPAGDECNWKRAQSALADLPDAIRGFHAHQASCGATLGLG